MSNSLATTGLSVFAFLQFLGSPNVKNREKQGLRGLAFDTALPRCDIRVSSDVHHGVVTFLGAKIKQIWVSGWSVFRVQLAKDIRAGNGVNIGALAILLTEQAGNWAYPQADLTDEMMCE